MARIPTFEAGQEALHPSEAGSVAMREAGVLSSRMGNQAGEMIRREGQEIGQGIAGIGKGIGDIVDTAQEHTDNMASIDAMQAITAKEVTAIGGISDAGTPKDGTTGAPLTDNPGRGSSEPLPLDANVPHPGEYAQYASDVHNTQDQFGADIVEHAASVGASQKAQDRIAKEVAASQNRIAVHAAAVGGEVAVNHALHSTLTSVNNVISAVDQDPSQLNNSLKQIDHIYDTVGNSMSGIVGMKGKEKADEIRAASKELAVTTAIESRARAGDTIGATKIMDANTDIIGSKREGMQTKIAALANQAVEAENRKDAMQVKRDHATMDQQFGQAWANHAPGDQMPDFARAPLGQKYPEKAAQLQEIWGRNEDAVLHRDQPNKDVSYQNAQPIIKDLLNGTSPDAALDNARKAYTSDDPAQRIGKADYDYITRLYNDPAAKNFAKATNDWLTKGGETQIDTIFAKGGGALPGGRSAVGQQAVQDWKSELNRRAAADPAHAHDLLDPTKSGNMVSPQALAPYRVTAASKQQYEIKQRQLDIGADAARANATGQPAIMPKDMTHDDAVKTYPKGTKVVLPDGRTWVAPGNETPKKMNLMQEEQPGNAASGAINASLQQGIDAHLDKNLFSSGRAAKMGIEGGVGKNLAPLTAQGQTVQVNAAAQPHFDGFLKELTDMGYKIDSLGGVAIRGKRGGFGAGYSEHAFGNAIDINPGKNPQGGGTNLPPNISAIAAKYGLVWGGNWNGRSRDPMHFEWSGKGNTQVAGQ